MTTIDTGTNELLCNLEDGVATVTLNKPEKRNALGDILTPALRSILLELEADRRCGAILLTGAGRAFCAGGDVSGMGPNRGKGNGTRAGSSDAPSEPPSHDQAVRNLIEKQESLTLRLGIANRIVPFDDLAAQARGLALELANGPRNAIRLMKQNVNRAVLGDLRACLAGEAEGMVRSVRTADHKEAVRAFLEKRAPRFER